MSTAHPPPSLPSKYRRKSIDVLDHLFSPSPTKSFGHYRSSPSSSSPIMPGLPGLSSLTPFTSAELSPLGMARTRIQSSPGVGFEIGLDGVDDYNGASPVWMPYGHNGGSGAWKGQRTQRQHISTNVSLPSFRASFSPSDDSEPPLTSDFDVSEFSEDMDVDLEDLSDDEDSRGRYSFYSYVQVHDEITDEEDVDILNDTSKALNTSYAASADHGHSSKVPVHDSSAISVADILLQFHDQPRVAKADSLEPSRHVPSPRPDLVSTSSEESPAVPSHVAGIEDDTPLSPLCPLPPSSPAMSPMSIHPDLPTDDVADGSQELGVGLATTVVMPPDSSPLLPLSFLKPSKVMSVQMLLQPLDPSSVPKSIEKGVKSAPSAKQPLANKQNQLHPDAVAHRSATTDLDIGTSDLITSAVRRTANTGLHRKVDATKDAKAKAVGTSVKVTKVMRVKGKEQMQKPKARFQITESVTESVQQEKRREGVDATGLEKRKKLSVDDGPKKKKSRIALLEEREGETKTRQAKEEGRTDKRGDLPRVPSIKCKGQSEAPPESIPDAPEKIEQTGVKSESVQNFPLSSCAGASSSQTKLDAQSPSTSPHDETMSSSEMEGLLIETFASSRASSMTPSLLYKAITQSRSALKDQRSRNEWVAVIETVLADARQRCGVFERVESSGKDKSDRPLEGQWFYVPEKDEDQDRAMVIRSITPRLEKRKETRKYKQYYWQPLDKMSKWDPEDEM